MKNKISVANLVMFGGAVVTLLFSFFGFFKFGDNQISAWDTDAFAFVSTIPAILGLVMIVWIACEMFGVNLPQDVLTFNPNQLKATWGIAAAGVMLAFVTTSGDKSAFFWLQMIGALAMAAGSVMALLGKGAETVTLGSSGDSSGESSVPSQTGPSSSPPPPGQQPPPPGAPGTNPPPPAG